MVINEVLVEAGFSTKEIQISL